MKKKKYLILIIISISVLFNYKTILHGLTSSKFYKQKFKRNKMSYDLTIVGNSVFADGIGRQAILLMDTLHDRVNLNFICTDSKINYKDIPDRILPYLKDTKNKAGKVTIYELPVVFEQFLKFLPKSHIKIAYSMFETSAITENWVRNINELFDAVVVPDEFLVGMYKGAGVKKPIFVIPLGIYLDDFLQQEIKKEKNIPFTFGNLTAVQDRKNIHKLIEAFDLAFHNDERVKLVINTRNCNKDYNPMKIKKMIHDLGLTNVELSWKSLSWKEYVDKMKTFDCYVSPSKGEGFSISPRESLALGVPTIVTENTAQVTIADSGYVRVVPSDILDNTYYYQISCTPGCVFDCTVEDLRDALVDVYENYQKYLDLAVKGREWVKQYRFQELQEKYLTLVKPQWIELGDEDKIENGHIVTTSEVLFDKYLKIIRE